MNSNKHLKVLYEGVDGGAGYVYLPRNNRAGHTKASCVWSFGGGWEHVSIRLMNGNMPTWDDMCFVKDLFWEENQCVVQYHPPKDEYVNNISNCLHLWRPMMEKMPMPPSFMVGDKELGVLM